MAIAGRLALLFLAIQTAWAQYVVSTSAGTIHFVTGEVLVDGKPADWAPLRFPLLARGQVLTTGNGRAEILLGSGVFLRIDRRSAVRMLDNRLEDAQVELQRGNALVEVVDIPKGSDVHVAVGPTRTSFRGIGLHRFEAAARLLRVFGGRAEVDAGGQRTEAGRGTTVHLGEALSVTRFHPRKDDLLVWSANRSYQLFLSNLEAPSHPTNWEITMVSPVDMLPDQGHPHFRSDQDRFYYSNRDFGVMIYPPKRGTNHPALRTPLPVNEDDAAPVK